MDKIRLKLSDYSKILDWLENLDNFAQLHGGGCRTLVGGKYQWKKTVFGQMLVVWHAFGFPREVQTGENLGRRYDAYYKKYKVGLESQLGIGGGLNDLEIAARLNLPEKLEKICPGFERMHALYGERANVVAPAMGSFGLDDEEITSDVGLDFVLDEEPNDTQPAGLFDEHQDPGSPTEILPGNEANVVESQDGDLEWSQGYLNESDMATETQPTNYFANVEASQSMPLSSPCVPPVSTPRASNAGLAPSSEGPPTPAHVRANRNPNAQIPRNRIPIPSHSSSKPSMAAVNSEKQAQKNDALISMVNAKRKWKEAKLLDRREARLETAIETARKERIDKKHQLTVLRSERKISLLLELFLSNKPLDQIEGMMKLIDDCDVPMSSRPPGE